MVIEDVEDFRVLSWLWKLSCAYFLLLTCLHAVCLDLVMLFEEGLLLIDYQFMHCSCWLCLRWAHWLLIHMLFGVLRWSLYCLLVYLFTGLYAVCIELVMEVEVGLPLTGLLVYLFTGLYAVCLSWLWRLRWAYCLLLSGLYADC